MPYTVPTSIIDLPSKGLVYPEDHPLRSGKVELKFPGSKEEDILANESYKEQNIVFDRLFSSVFITKCNYDDLISGDKDMIFIATRILMFGKYYNLNYLLPGEKEFKPIKADLTTLKPKVFDESLMNPKNEFDFVLPHTQHTITFKLLTHKDEKLIQEEVDGLKKISPELDQFGTIHWCHQIVAVNGNRSIGEIRDFVKSGALITLDSVPLAEYIAKISPGMDLRFDYTSPEQKVYNGLYLPIGANFFRPSLGL